MLCYNCGTTLNNKNRSAEHIIPNAIGGKRKGYNLLCKTCNEQLGQTIDRELVARFSAFTTGIVTDRKNRRKIADKRVTERDNISYQRAIVKICLNYYLSKGYDIQYCEAVKHFVKDGSGAISFYHHQAVDTDGAHLIYLYGGMGVLYAYINLFNHLHLIIPFNMQYEGEDIESCYWQDVMNGEECKKDIFIHLTRIQLQRLPLWL